MFTFFTTPKPFAGHIDVIQRNALRSWQRVHPDAEIILFGDDAGAAEVCRELGVRHVPQVRRNSHGTKYLAGIYDQAQELARHRIRVNSVLPGNVIRGSGIWSEEYVRGRAGQAGIPVEQVEEYYNRKVPLGRQCTPEDVANAVLYLVSDLSSYITGCSHLVDGGQEMRA